MKRKIAAMLAGALLLTGCSGETAAPQEKAEKEIVSSGEATEPEQEMTVTVKSMISLELEHDIYDPSVEQMTYLIHNDSEAAVTFGAEYAIQRLENGAWRELETKGDTAWIAIAYGLQPGATMAQTVSFALYKERPTAGTYRLVKQVESETLYAEFEVGESIYTAETPYGFAPLEQLPADYSAASAGDMDTVFTAEGVKNVGAVETFVRKAGLGVDCQLRTVQDYGEGAPMVIDVIHEKDHFFWRMWCDGDVTEKRFSYLVSDGETLYLTNGADWESQQRYGGNAVTPQLIPEGMTAEMVQAVEEQTAARKESNVTRYKVWSEETEDGIWSAALWKGDSSPKTTEFSVEHSSSEGGSWGSIYDLKNWDGQETAITALEWQADGTLRLTCDTTEGSGSVLCFHPETEELTTVLLLCGGVPLADE
ncbi:MAG: hypothetical protein IJZ52_02005 [Clostridium sp.]|nr:hypothetical protein [Clostridium sp.]